MTGNWPQWEGRTVEGKFALGECLGGSERSAVFRARRVDGGQEDIVIKFVAADGLSAEQQLARWKAASELEHPNLVRLVGQGHYSAQGGEFVYVVEEYAEENLAQIVPERRLTGDETRGMLGPVLSALEHIHGKGLVHGRIRPSNILAAGDRIKLSSDSLSAAGYVPQPMPVYDAPEVAAHGISPAGDVWSLGVTLIEVLTQHVPAWDAAHMSAPDVGNEVPEPFRGIARRCLEMDPAKRCGLAEIRDRLGRPAGTKIRISEAASPARKAAPKWHRKWAYWVAAIPALAIIALVIVGSWGKKEPVFKEVLPVQSPAKRAAAHPQPSAAVPPPSEPVATAPHKATVQDEIVERVMPEVSPSARRTIEGKIKVRVKVFVDSDGNVTAATLQNSGPSKYFARVSLEAARQWRFAPAGDESRTWSVLFAFTRARTDASAARAR